MRILDLSSADPGLLRQGAIQVQLDASSASTPTKVILPKRRFRLTVGPIYTSGAEATFLAGAFRFGADAGDQGGTLPTFEVWDLVASGSATRPAASTRHYLPSDGRALTFVFRGDELDAEWLMATTTATSGVLQLSFDGVDG